jgi:hypothetical protein
MDPDLRLRMSDRVVPRRLARTVAVALLAVAAGGCAGTRSFTIPPAAPALREPAHKVSAGVGIYFSPDVPGRVASQQIGGAEGPTTYLLPIGDAVVDTYSALLPRLFQRVERVYAPAPPPGSDLAGILEVDLGNVGMALPTAFETRPCQVSVEEAFTLRDRRGAVVASWSASGAGEEPRGAIVQCGGQAAASALERAAEEFLRALSDDPQVRAWIAASGSKPWPAEEPGELRRTLAQSSESTEPEHPAVRTFGVYGGVGYFLPASGTSLTSPQGGLALLLGWTWRPLAWVGLNLEAQNLASTYGTGAPGSLDRIDLNQTTFAPMVRFSWPTGIVEPWVSFGPALDFAYLNGTAGDTSVSSYQSHFIFGAQAAAGLEVVVTPSVELGARWQWLFAYADLSALSTSTAPLGGQSFTVTGGYYWP